MRTCRTCSISKDLKEFRKRTVGPRKKRRLVTCKECETAKRLEYRKTVPGRFARIKGKAKSRSIDFEITISEFETFEDSSCNYCGDVLDVIRLDRINSSLGYALTNVVPCCSKCNFAKHELSRADFLLHIEKIYINQLKVSLSKVGA